MGYTNSWASIIWWDKHTKKLKYCSSENVDEYNKWFDKGCSPGSNFINGIDKSDLPTIKIDLSDHLFIKDYISDATVTFPPRVLIK